MAMDAQHYTCPWTWLPGHVGNAGTVRVSLSVLGPLPPSQSLTSPTSIRGQRSSNTSNVRDFEIQTGGWVSLGSLQQRSQFRLLPFGRQLPSAASPCFCLSCSKGFSLDTWLLMKVARCTLTHGCFMELFAQGEAQTKLCEYQ